MPTGLARRRGLAVAATVGYAALASLSRPLTGAAAAAVAVPVVVVLVRVRGRRPPVRADAGRLRRTALAWGVVVVLAAAVELVAFARQPAYDVASPEHPTISLLLDPVTEGWPLRFVAWCCWLSLGWAVARR